MKYVGIISGLTKNRVRDGEFVAQCDLELSPPIVQNKM
jgi:hypothetical protein